jgi:hypothetical protein
MTPSLNQFFIRLGPWSVFALIFLWLVFFLLLLIHILRRRSGFYSRNPLSSLNAKITKIILDVFLFLLVLSTGLVAVWVFSPGRVFWEIRLAMLSGCFSILGIFIVLREGLSARISSSTRKQEEVKSKKNHK